jgi:hypothetical protein
MGDKALMRIYVERPVGECPLGRLRKRWKDSFEIDLKEKGCDDRRWIELTQDRIVT